MKPQYTFDELFSDETRRGTKIPASAYKTKGKYPIIDQGKGTIAGYTDEAEGLFTDVPAIIFGDHTRIVKYVDVPFFIGADGVKILSVKKAKDNPKYFFYALKNARIPDTGYNRHFKWLKEQKFLRPAIDEQNSIVERLDATLHLINNTESQLVKLDALVKSRFIEMFGDLPLSCAMKDVCKIITDGTHQPPKFVREGIPFMFVSNIVQDRLTYDAEKYIDDVTYSELVKRTPIEIGDVLLSTVGSYGHAAVVENERKFLFQRHIAYLKPDREKINSRFMHALLLSDGVQRQIESKVKGIAQKTLNLSEIKCLQIPLPSLPHQNQFADFVTQADKSKLAIRKLLEKQELLRASLMQEYFG